MTLESKYTICFTCLYACAPRFLLPTLASYHYNSYVFLYLSPSVSSTNMDDTTNGVVPVGNSDDDRFNVPSGLDDDACDVADIAVDTYDECDDYEEVANAVLRAGLEVDSTNLNGARDASGKPASYKVGTCYRHLGSFMYEYINSRGPGT